MSPEVREVAFPEALGFCGGVRAADQLMHDVSEAAPAGVVVLGLHHIVHNADVVGRHEAAGVKFIDGVDEVMTGSAVVISAHGVGPEVVDAIKQKGAEPFDATCPLVTRTHHGVKLARERGEKVLYVCHGKPGEVEKLHDEVAGMVGHLDYTTDETGKLIHDPIERSYLELNEDISQIPDVLSEGGRYRIISQTTLHADDAISYRDKLVAQLEEMQLGAEVSFVPSGDVCRAVADRQAGVKRLFELGPTRVVVVTDPTSKNGKSYVTQAKGLATGTDIEVYTVANADEAALIESKDGLTAITASASTPDRTIAEVTAVFADTEVPPTDRSFTLPDGKPEAIAAKFADLAAGQVAS